MDDAGVVTFDLKFPVHDLGLIEHVGSALGLGLPPVAWEPVRDETLTILGNGPTARHAPLDGPILAVNGALSVCLNRGVAPTYWAACDPQSMVADFLVDAPAQTTYLLASKCHPLVFQMLEDRDVRLWHLDDHCTWEQTRAHDPIMSCVSITLCCFELMYRLGYRRFQTWGWDGCFVDGDGHASPQPESPPENWRLINVGGQQFATTTTWALEAQDAVNKFRTSRHPFSVTIHGGGMIDAIVRAVG